MRLNYADKVHLFHIFTKKLILSNRIILLPENIFRMVVTFSGHLRLKCSWNISDSGL